jgi:hypothetical protein
MPYDQEFAHYKPLHRLTENQRVQALLGRARIYKSSNSSREPLPAVSLADYPPREWMPDYVFAVDGSMDEVPVDTGYPGAAIGYITAASVLLDIKKMRRLDEQRPVNPREFATIEQAETIDSALPGSNVVLDDEESAETSFRRALFELFQAQRMSDEGESLLDTYEALLTYKPENLSDAKRQKCPYEDDCFRSDRLYMRGHAEYQCSCVSARPLFSTDALRIHESFNPEGSNQSVLTQIMNVIERLWVIHFLRTLEQEHMLPVLQRLAIVIDGPLAVFDDPAWLSSSIKLELARINEAARQAMRDQTFDLLLFGIEKTGVFMEHLIALDKGPDGQGDALPRQTMLLLNDAYIKQRIIFSKSVPPYGRNTYFGRKAFYKTATGELIVLNTPFLAEEHQDVSQARADQYPRLADTMRLLDALVSARYRNSLMPLIAAHAEAAIPLNLGKRVLEKLARQLMADIKNKSA